MNNERDEILDQGRRRFIGTAIAAIPGAAVMSTGLLTSRRASAQTRTDGLVKQPAVIGYPNEKGVLIERVIYQARNMGTNIVANLFKPPGFDQSKNYPAIVVTHPFGGVKEQTAGLYAQHLAEEGFITVAYDASYQGESGGAPRLMEVPAQRLDDISCAIDYLVQQPQVNPDWIGSLGICAGGGYAMCNATTELRVKAVATVSMFSLGDARRRAMGRLSYEERMKRLKDAGEQRSKEARGEPVRLVQVSPDSPAEFTERTPILYREGYEYYMTARGKHPNSPNRYIFSSLPLQMAFFPFDQVETISPRPILMVVGGKADTKFWSDEVYAKAREPKELFIVDGATHIDMYDKPQFIMPAVAKLKEFFAKYLT
jgi:fermentation-respiration switch protein FrsA (DUF1100 family)